MQKLIIILGPTATGKSDLAVEVAKQFNGEVISADSRQVYKDLDIGSGKITKKEMKGVPHHLLDVASPSRVFTVAQFKKKAEKAIKQISKQNKIPIICGGTAFYIDTLIYDLELPNVLANRELRKDLEKKSLEELCDILKKLDSERLAEIDTKNKVRLIRSIEIATELGKVPKFSKKKEEKSKKYEALWIGLNPGDEILRDRIEKRVTKRFSGMKKEVKQLHANGLSIKRMKQLGLEYRYLAMLLEKEITEKEFLETLNTKIWQFAKRQKTWFRGNKNILWFKSGEDKKIEKVVRKFLQ